jgi:hypothetical protein
MAPQETEKTVLRFVEFKTDEVKIRSDTRGTRRSRIARNREIRYKKGLASHFVASGIT